MRSVMSVRSMPARFDDRNLIGFGGLVSVVRLAERCGWPESAADLLRWKIGIELGGCGSGGEDAGAGVRDGRRYRNDRWDGPVAPRRDG